MLLSTCGPRRVAASATVAVWLAGGHAGAQRPAQNPAPRATFRSGIELVQIDVVVTDERGGHMRGLTARDFEIFDRGKRQAMAAFEEVTHARADAVVRGPMLPLTVRSGVASNQTAQSDRLVVMVIDDLHIWRGRTDRAKDIAREVLARLGFEATMAEDSPLVALSAGALPATDLALALTAIPLAPLAEEKETRVALALQVSAPRTALEEADERLRDELTYEVIVVDEKKNKVTSAGGLVGRITLSPVVAGGSPPDVVTYQVADTIRLQPGRYQLRLSAISEKLAQGGSVYLPLDIPDFKKERVTIGGLAVGYAAGPRVATTVSPRNTTATRAAARTRATAPASVLPFPPTLDRTFAATDTLRVYFEVASREGMAGLTGTLAILGAHGAPVHASLPFVPDKDGRVELAVLLEGLERGPYIARAMVTGGENSATREIGFLIR